MAAGLSSDQLDPQSQKILNEVQLYLTRPPHIILGLRQGEQVDNAASASARLLFYLMVESSKIVVVVVSTGKLRISQSSRSQSFKLMFIIIRAYPGDTRYCTLIPCCLRIII